MQFLQYMYTSCKKGQSSGAGFQVYALSKGLSLPEQQELERLGAYVPPTNLSGRPTPEEISLQFPINFQFFKLQSGRTGILQSVYKGQDYSGRFGNYFCHALVLSMGDWTAYPIQFWQHPAFKTGLSAEEEQITTTPEPLPILELEPHFSSVECFERSAAWMRHKPEYLGHFQYTLHIVSSSSRPVILTGSSSEVVHWMTLLQLSFPLHLALDSTFSTYQLDPERSRSLFSGTPREGGRLTLSGRPRVSGANSPWICDLEQPVLESVSPGCFLSCVLEAIQAESSQKLDALHQLAQKVGLSQRNQIESLALIFEVFLSQQMISSAQWQNIPGEQWIQALQWLQAQDTPELLRDIVKRTVFQAPEQHLQSWQAQQSFQNKTLSGILAVFLWQVWYAQPEEEEEEEEEEEQVQQAHQAGQNLLQRLSRQSFESGDIGWLRNTLEEWKHQAPNASIYLRVWLLKNGIQELTQTYLTQNTQSLAPPAFQFSDFLREWPLYLALGDLQEHELLSKVTPSNPDWLQRLLQQLCKTPEHLLAFLGQRPNTVFEIWLDQLMPLLNASETQGFNLFQQVYQQHPEPVWSYLRANYTGSERPLYFQSLRAWLRAHQQPVQFFIEQQSWLHQNTEMQNDLSVLKQDLMNLAKNMSEPQLFKLLELAVSQSEWSESERTDILTLYNRAFSLEARDPGTIKHVEYVLNWRQQHFKNWQEQPDRLTLFAYLQALQTPETAQQILPQLKNSERVFPWQGISAQDYRFFLTQMWSVLLRPNQSWLILPAYYHPDHDAVFWEQLQVFQARIKPDSKGFPPNWESLCGLYLKKPLSKTSFKQGLYNFLIQQFSQYPGKYQNMLKYARNQEAQAPQEKELYLGILSLLEDLEHKMGDLLVQKSGLIHQLKELTSRWFQPKTKRPKAEE